MSQGIHLIMPMGGKGSRFSENGFSIPKPLIIINDKPFFLLGNSINKKICRTE